jgi:hypothetical protein
VLKLSALEAVETGKHACHDACMDGFLTKLHLVELDAMLPRDTPAEAAA